MQPNPPPLPTPLTSMVASARSHCPTRSHAAMIALYVTGLGSIPFARIASIVAACKYRCPAN
jgi:hypothetical protein